MISSNDNMRIKDDKDLKHEALLRGVFEMLDEDGDGYVAVAQLGSTFERLGVACAQSAIDNVLRRTGSWMTCDKRSEFDDQEPASYVTVDFTEFTRLYEAVMTHISDGVIISEAAVSDQSADEIIIRNEMEEAVREAFNLFDLDSNGYISAEELHQVLTAMGVIRTHDVQCCRSMIARADRNGDGHVDYDEFKHLLAAGGALLLF